jgi:hypothetical protein
MVASSARAMRPGTEGSGDVVRRMIAQLPAQQRERAEEEGETDRETEPRPPRRRRPT